MWPALFASPTLCGMPRRKSSPLREILAENVRAERARCRITQEDLAERAGISRVYVGSIERGEFACSIDVLARVATALGVDPPELLVPSKRQRTRSREQPA